jgi:glycosyltransferase involved in cell wall biosynthesis
MNVLHICTSDIAGGAAIACNNINDALNSIGVNSNILVQVKETDNRSVEDINSGLEKRLGTGIRILIDYAFIKFLSKKERGRFSFPFIGTKISNHSLVREADIINLHWINGGFLSLKSLRELFSLNKPIAWTFHDMWTFTGGCHYTGGCINYQSLCKNCPSLIFSGENDSSNKIFSKKEELFGGNKFSIITCSNWLAEETRNSYLLKNFPVDVVPNPIDPNKFTPYKSNEARKILNLPDNKILFLFSSFTISEVRKGFHHLKNALILLEKLRPELKDRIEIVLFGSSNSDDLKGIPFPFNDAGRISGTDKIAQYYSAADLFIAPSEQENLSNSVMESLACGTPVLAFNIGGMPDMINHRKNGYLANDLSPETLLEGLLWFIDLNKDSREVLKKNACTKVINNFSPGFVAGRYQEIYKRLLDSQ